MVNVAETNRRSSAVGDTFVWVAVLFNKRKLAAAAGLKLLLNLRNSTQSMEFTQTRRRDRVKRKAKKRDTHGFAQKKKNHGPGSPNAAKGRKREMGKKMSERE